MKVKVVPHLDTLGNGASGIHTVVRKWFEHLPKFGVQLAGLKDDNFDVLAVNAGMVENLPNCPIVSVLHGLYWTADYKATSWEWDANKNVIESIRKADQVTVPSAWVAEVIQRDARINPTVIPHGIDWQEWLTGERNYGYILGYGKNRAYADVCDPSFLSDLARRFPNQEFLATFPPPGMQANIRPIGVQPPREFKKTVQHAAVVISPIKETFGVLTLEAMASGVPVLGYAYGGNLDLIKHQETGYLARPGDIQDLSEGLNYCLTNRARLSANCREAVKAYSWDASCQLLTGVFEKAMQRGELTVGVVISSYNYGSEEKLGRAIRSVLEQSIDRSVLTTIIVVDDGSPDGGDTENLVSLYRSRDDRVHYVRQDNSGVAAARNRGIAMLGEGIRYVVCLDADDALLPMFVSACVEELEKDKSLGVAYTGLMTCLPDGWQEPSKWPGPFNYDQQLLRKNQIPTACVFRREAWKRVGGYRSRYCPNGAGSEDAEFWTRLGAYGWNARQVTEAPLFLYSYGQGRVSGNREYREQDWLAMHPWAKDKQHPFVSIATPERISHPVRQYDEPAISIIIPVGPGHKKQVFNALDSLEAQSFRKWEAILVDDTGDDAEPWEYDGNPEILSAYPYLRIFQTAGKRGAGAARNLGAKHARAPLLLFLDADDNLVGTDALKLFLEGWRASGDIIYSDYFGKAYLDEQAVAQARRNGRLLNYDAKQGLATLRHYSSDYNCEQAIRQPANPLFIWNLITSLVPKKWHDEVGGFDEQMPSWEDWDYWIRMARAGKCFSRIPEPLVAYRFYTGSRRENGIELIQEIE